MLNRNSDGILQGKFKELGYFVERLGLAKRGSREVFGIICESIAPLLRGGEAFEPYVLEWANKDAEHRSHCCGIRKQAYAEIKDSYSLLQTDLAREGMLSDEALNMKIEILKKLFSYDAVSSITIDSAEHHFKMICCQLSNIGRNDLIKNYVKFKKIKKYRLDEQGRAITCGKGKDTEAIIDEIEEIDEWVFAPSVYKLKELEREGSWLSCCEPWVAAKFIFYAETLWNMSASYFDSEILDFEKKHSQWWELNSLYGDYIALQRIKEGRSNDIMAPGLFTVERYLQFVDLIYRKIILKQATTITSPYALELDFTTEEAFVLLVEKVKGEKPERRRFVQCKDQGVTSTGKPKKSDNREAIEKIMNAQEGETIQLSLSAPEVDAEGKKHTNPKEYASYRMEKLKIKPVLQKVFFVAIKGKAFTLRSRRVVISEIPGLDIKELNDCIGQLKKN